METLLVELPGSFTAKCTNITTTTTHGLVKHEMTISQSILRRSLDQPSATRFNGHLSPK
ncbi:hypothetical protein FOWG_11368 [Fusarium oxysporum f. sp. lycopersici MN25]|nr:hypothetical protein FOWG_11368 [Fusarium oxysporum f. sp. lycopersici MN25]